MRAGLQLSAGGVLASAPLAVVAPWPALRPASLLICESPGHPPGSGGPSLGSSGSLTHQPLTSSVLRSSLVLGRGGWRGCDHPSLGPCAPSQTPHPQRKPPRAHSSPSTVHGSGAQGWPPGLDTPLAEHPDSSPGEWHAGPPFHRPGCIPASPGPTQGRGPGLRSTLASPARQPGPLAWGGPLAVSGPSLATHTAGLLASSWDSGVDTVCRGHGDTGPGRNALERSDM